MFSKVVSLGKQTINLTSKARYIPNNRWTQYFEVFFFSSYHLVWTFFHYFIRLLLKFHGFLFLSFFLWSIIFLPLLPQLLPDPHPPPPSLPNPMLLPFLSLSLTEEEVISKNECLNRLVVQNMKTLFVQGKPRHYKVVAFVIQIFSSFFSWRFGFSAIGYALNIA